MILALALQTQRLLEFMMKEVLVLFLSFPSVSSALWQSLWASSSNDDSVCGIWVAESTIRNAGLGMYAGKEFQEKQILQRDLVIPIVDLEMHNPNKKVELLWDEYTWNAAALKLHGEGVSEINAASPGFGSAANCVLSLINVDEWIPEDMTDTIQLHRFRDPGAGASTRFHNRESTAKVAIKPGQEFFVNYGDHWFKSRPQLGPIPMFDELDLASTMLMRYRKLQEKYPAQITNELWQTFVKSTAFTESRTLVGAFNHDDETELERLRNFGDNVKDLRRDESMRSLEWLENHGVCGDHLAPRLSTIEQAGFGAFSTRDLRVGMTVGALPMIHIIDRSSLDMYEVIAKSTVNLTKPVVPQLILNYCFGHGQSTLLLCPYGPVVNYVNHNATQANVKLRWSERLAKDQEKYFSEPLEYLKESGAYAKLAMELVATKNISAGEEVFLDYGDAWEMAWSAHVKSWEATGAEEYRSAGILNSKMVEPMPTVFEELRNPSVPINVELQCDTTFQSDTWKKHKNDLRRYLREQEGKWWPCDVLRYKKQRDGRYLYSVFMYQGRKMKKKRLVFNVPVEIFHFVDRPVSTTIDSVHLRG